MKLVLLPGLDGTGELFGPFISLLRGIDITIIPLPLEGNQDYDTLTRHIADQLPDEPFTLLSESFSGPIAVKLISTCQFKITRVIFVATFLRPPKPLTLNLMKYIPLKRLMRMPFSDYFIKIFLLGRHVDCTLLNFFKVVINRVPEATIKSRILSISKLVPVTFKSDLEAIYLSPDNDMLVPPKSSDDFKKAFSNLTIINISGPHLILQFSKDDCASLLNSLALID